MTRFEFSSAPDPKNLPPEGADCQAHRKSHKITVAVRLDHLFGSGSAPKLAAAIIKALPSW